MELNYKLCVCLFVVGESFQIISRKYSAGKKTEESLMVQDMASIPNTTEMERKDLRVP